MGREFVAHSSVDHSAGEYVRFGFHHSNTVENYFSILKRGVIGTFHHVSEQHLARYLATAYGSLRYPFTEGKRAALFGGVSTSVKKGGNQIEYTDQDPRIHELFVQETAKNGVEVRMKQLVG